MNHGAADATKMTTRCPVCRYDLRGLPAEHRCPECGLGIDDSMNTWRMRKPSRFIWAVTVGNNLLFLFALISYLRGDGARYLFAVTPTVLCVGALLIGAFWIRKRPRIVLSQTSVATKGRFSWRFEVFQLADLDVVSREPLVVRMAASKESETGRRNVPLPNIWMTPRQAAEFRDNFVDRWRECRGAPGEASKAGPDAGSP